jgi:tRNA pseudouridine38-40 synthase
MRNFKLTLAYDGTDFHGWQIQPGLSTIQGEITAVLRKVTQENIVLHAAGRTDAGVHAQGQVANFQTQSHLNAQEFQRALNALLPPAIRVLAAEEAGPDFHARWHAQAKTYHYRIWRGRVVPPFDWRYVLHYPFPLDGAAMAEAARHFEGEHDFTSFAASTGSEDEDRERTPVREIFRSELRSIAVPGCETIASNRPAVVGEPDELLFAVRGRSFLRYMVRKMVGTLIDVGKGRLALTDIPRLFELRDRSKSGPTVPPHGLCLVAVEYPEARRV